MKITLSNTNQNFWENESKQRCINTQPPRTYINDETLTFMPCYDSCGSCSVGGDPLNHHCLTCLISSGYYHFLNSSSTNCYKVTEVEHNYFLYPSTAPSESYFKKCNDVCYSCSSENVCTECSNGYYKYCNPSTSSEYLCYKEIQNENEFIDGNCIRKCYSECKTCDGPGDSANQNCLTCKDPDKILYNKNCISNCPSGYHKFENQCVFGCPPYTEAEGTGTNLKCDNCKNRPEENPNRNCIYMGSRDDILKKKMY